ncbi:MAG: NAD-dependent epimerase/dehydratase family protein [Pseudomonadota bacterium]
MLITGAGGRLGRLLQAARADSPDLHHRFLFQSRGAKADLRWIPGESLDHLPHCIAIIALWGATSGEVDALAQNAALVSLSADLARGLAATRVIHLSSAAVYGPGHNMNEDHPTDHCNNYGKSKLKLEDAVDFDRQKADLTHISLRLANVVGADSVAPVLRGERPAKIDNFSLTPPHQGPIRSYIGAKGLLQIFDTLLTLPAQAWPKVLNVAAPAPVSMDALARAAGAPVFWQQAPQTAVPEVTLDVSRLQALMPGITLATTAAELVAEWRRLESLA